MSLVERAGAVEAGQTWRCDESRADPDDVPAPHDVPLWAPHPRFTVVVDRVEDDYVELTVTTGNSHPRTPDFVADEDAIDRGAEWRCGDRNRTDDSAGGEGL